MAKSIEEIFLHKGWEILENRWRYYCGRAYTNVECIPDEEYDRLEKEYDAMAIQLGQEPYSTDMVSFNMNRPSCQMVHIKMCTKYNLDPKTTTVVG